MRIGGCPKKPADCKLHGIFVENVKVSDVRIESKTQCQQTEESARERKEKGGSRRIEEERAACLWG